MTELVRADIIYHALFDDRAFEGLPAALARATGARSALIQWRHTDGMHEVLASSHFSRDFIQLYAAKYAPIDPWVAAARARPFDELIRLDAHVSLAAFEDSKFHRDFLAPFGEDTYRGLGVVFGTPWGEGMVSVQRGRSSPPFDVADLALLEECLPHLRRLLQVRGELAAHRRGPKVARDAFDDLALGAILTGGDGQVVRMNHAADRVVRRGDGLLVQANRLTCADPGSRHGLEAAIDLATAGRDPAATAIVVERNFQALAYLVSVTPMTGPSGRGRALVVFRDPDPEQPARRNPVGAFPGLGGKSGVNGGAFPPERARALAPPRPWVGVGRTIAGLAATFGFGRWSQSAGG
jgi:PAS domain-containing protein